MSSTETLFVGIGSPHGDDVVGWKVADQLRGHVRARGAGSLDVRIEKAKSPIQTLDWINGIRRLVLCDGCRGMGRPGQTRRWEWPMAELDRATWSGTHDFSLSASLQLAERLGRLPPLVVLWSMEITTGDAGDKVSRAVAEALPRFVQRVQAELLNQAARPTTRVTRAPTSRNGS